MPLAGKWWLGKKKGKEAYVVPTVVDGHVRFAIGHDPENAPTADNDGTVGRSGASCISCGAAVDLSYIRAEGRAGRMGSQLTATAAEGNRRRIYVAPTPEHQTAADIEPPKDLPDGDVAINPRWFSTPAFGMTRFADLFTPRQLVMLTTFGDLVIEARELALQDAIAAGMPLRRAPREGRNRSRGIRRRARDVSWHFD